MASENQFVIVEENLVAMPIVAHEPLPEPVPCSSGSTRRSIMFEYEYINETWPDEIAILWTCNGKISFQSRYTVTVWHGSFCSSDLTGILTAVFDCRGEHEKTHVLHYRGMIDGRDTWTGYDYRARRITMKRMGSSEWDQTSRTWIPVAMQ